MRPTIALACILKDELENIPQLLKSIEGCFDEIHFTDTGSTDGSIELIQSLQKENASIFLHHFEWVDDFSKARNHSFSHPKTDFIMWMDLDDVLASAEGFKSWRDNVMEIADIWIATYNYASDSNGKVVCAFQRERVVRRCLETKWIDFVHEGIDYKSPHKKNIVGNYATSWSVLHKRSDKDAEKDKARNLRLFKDSKNLSPRMRYYYGKELFENQKPLDAIVELRSAIAEPKLEPHDRVMGIQYASMCAMQLNQYDHAIQLAHQGLQLDPTRAEFFVITGDCYIKMQKFAEAVPFYLSATGCAYRGAGSVALPIHAHEDSYKHYPLNQLARVYANLGDLDTAKAYTTRALALGENKETSGILADIEKIKSGAGIGSTKEKTKTQDIVISCPPEGLYEWDEEIYKTKGIGGSETAVVEMAKWLAALSGQKVIIFNNRSETKTFRNVEYRPARELPLYFATTLPQVNINWRHNIKVTEAPTYLWCHDLSAPGIDHPNYKKVLALSQFHKEFLVNLCNVPRENIQLTRNGVDPERFKMSGLERDLNRVIFSSSPDRGLEAAMLVMDEVVKEVSEAYLTAYYGFDNMLKMGKQAEVDRLKAMIAERPYIHYVGNISQRELTQVMYYSNVWLYPTNFLETFCITAIEAICSGVYPIVRGYGALKDTLSYAARIGKAKIIDSDCQKPEEIALYAAATIKVLRGDGRYGTQPISPEDYSWESVAREWIKFMELVVK